MSCTRGTKVNNIYLPTCNRSEQFSLKWQFDLKRIFFKIVSTNISEAIITGVPVKSSDIYSRAHIVNYISHKIIKSQTHKRCTT